MEESTSSSFEYKALESDIQSLAAEVQRSRESAEFKNANERALVKEAIRAFPRLNSAERPPGGGVPSPQPAASAANSPLPDYAQSAPAEVKLEIEYLLDVALQHGLNKAFAESEKSPYFVQDAFHDALAGKLYPELQRRGIVK
jgi:hypothetical protein